MAAKLKTGDKVVVLAGKDKELAGFILYSSVASLFGNIGQANYGAATMGIAGLSRIIAMEGERNNVRSNCLAPVAWTRMTQSVPVKEEAAAAPKQPKRQHEARAGAAVAAFRRRAGRHPSARTAPPRAF